MKIYVVRHGETDLNVDDRYQGSSDDSLNIRGLAQANNLALRLPEGVAAVVASPLRRALETAEVVAVNRGLRVLKAPEFRERKFGVLERLTRAEAESRYPALSGRNILQQWDDAPPGAETIRDVARRVSDGMAKLKSMHLGDPIVLVTHGFVIRIIQHLVERVPEEKIFSLPRIQNGEFIEFRQ